MSKEFVDDAVHNRIAAKLSDAFVRHYRHRPSPGEEQSWRNSLRAVSQVFELGRIDDHGVILEYQLPLTSRRLDCMVMGRNREGQDEAVVMELKQWSECEATEEPSIVRTAIGGARRDTLHPAAQAKQYRDYLADMHTAFYEGAHPVQLSACSYLHNYDADENDPLFSRQYSDLIRTSPIFAADDADALVDFLRHRLEAGNGAPVLERIENSRFRPSKKLLEHVANVIRTEPAFILLDEQKVVFDRIFSTVVAGHRHRKKHVFLVNGGPGTGKSVIAIQLMAELARKGLNAQYATGSQAFTKTMHRILGARASAQFRYFSNYGTATPSEIDILICDEAHRIRATSTNRFTPKTKQTKRTQIQELVDAAKVSVFFIDDRQVVRPGEVGSMALVRNAATEHNCELREYALDAQFRCAGSDGFVNWIDNTLDVRETANVLWNQREEAFEFRIFQSPEMLENAIRKRVAEGHSARVTAGFCWPWSKDLQEGGKLRNDVVIGDYRRPWNARSGVTGLARGIPREIYWAHDPGGIDQIGCVYTAQGFEFDYVGVIWGPDLVYDLGAGKWRGDKTKSRDWIVSRSAGRFAELVKNTYRVLLSRGLKGCYMYFMDKDTEAFVRSRTEGLDSTNAHDAKTLHLPPRRPQTAQLPSSLPVVSGDDLRPYVNAVPLYDLQIAAGHFSGEQTAPQEDSIWVALPDTYRIGKDLFVAQVKGESMNRLIPDGAWCLFRANPTGSREGRVVVVQHRELGDVDTGAHVTVKTYRSEKSSGESDGQWTHTRITLYPHSTQPRYKPIELTKEQAEDLRVVAEFVAVIG